MGENVTVFGDLADKYDALVAHDEQLLDNYVDESGYSLSSMVVASTAIAFMRFSQTFTDMGRIGNGVLIEGGVKGVGKDALRALNIVGTAGAVTGRASTLLKVVQAGGTETCAPVSQTNALRLTGQRFVMTLSELARRAGLNMPRISAVGSGRADYQAMLGAMNQMGVPAREFAPAAQSFEELFTALRGAGKGVVTFPARFLVRNPRTGQMVEVGHRLYAYIGRAGNLIIRDPARGRVLSSAAEIRNAFGSSAHLGANPAIFVPNALVVQASHLAQGLSEIAIAAESLALRVLPVIPVRAQDPHTALQALDVRESIAANTLPRAGQSVHVVRRGDNLWNIAKHYYGHGSKATIIYEGNRKTIGADWNLIKPEQRLVIPPLPSVGPHSFHKH